MLAGSHSRTASRAASSSAARGREEGVAAAEDLRRGDLVAGRGLDVVQDDRQGQIGQVVPDLADLAQLGLRDDGHPAAGVGQPELEVAELVHFDRDGDVDRARGEDAELGHDPVPAALGDQGGPVPVTEAEVEKAGGEAADEGPHVGERGGFVLRPGLLPDEDVAGEGDDALFEELRQGPLGHGRPPRPAGSAHRMPVRGQSQSPSARGAVRLKGYGKLRTGPSTPRELMNERKGSRRP